MVRGKVLAIGGLIFKKNDEQIKKSLISRLAEEKEESNKKFGFSEELR